jgi:DNA-binding NarL/FixJ family response regulator
VTDPGDEEAATSIRVVLGEDNYLALEGISRVLERAGDIELVGTAGDLGALRSMIDWARPDVVLTDIRMPPTNTDEGIRIASELRSSHPEVGVVVLSQHADASYAAVLFEQGAGRRGYLLKERVKDFDELILALRTVADGGSVVDPRIVEELVSVRREREESRLDTLTPRELEILGMIAEGRSNASIADALVVTKRAVERHISGIFAKLDLGEDDDVSRRVKAAVLYLSDTSASPL